MSQYDQDTLDQIEEEKQNILDSLENVKRLVKSTGHDGAITRMEAYVVGGIEQACFSFGTHNYCIESILKELKEELEFDPEAEEEEEE